MRRIDFKFPSTYKICYDFWDKVYGGRFLPAQGLLARSGPLVRSARARSELFRITRRFLKNTWCDHEV